MAEFTEPPKATNIPELVQESTVVDCDVHIECGTEEMIEERASHFTNEINKKLFREAMLKEEGRGGVRWYPGGNVSSTIPGKVYNTYTDIEAPEDVEKPASDLGVDYSIINTLYKINLVSDPDAAVDEMIGLNNVILNNYLDNSEKLLGLIHLQTRKPDKAAEEIDRLADEDKLVGAFIYSGTTDKPLGHPDYHQIYEAAADNDLPIVYHASAASINTMPHNPARGWGFRNLLGPHILNHSFIQMETITSLIVEGVPVKYPDIEFVINESGMTFMPYLMGRMNREHAEWRSYAPMLEKTPEEYIRDHFYFGTQPLPETNDINHTIDALSAIGPDNILFTSDFPHIDFDHIGSVVNKYLGRFSESEQKKILGGNATELFGIN